MQQISNGRLYHVDYMEVAVMFESICVSSDCDLGTIAEKAIFMIR